MTLWTRMRAPRDPQAHDRPAVRGALADRAGAARPRQDVLPDRPRDRRLVGSVTGAELIGVSRDRFTRLARAGCLRPAHWYLNRYRALVWLYPADEVLAFAAAHPEWLTGRLPGRLRDRLADGTDLRARGWRDRRTAQLVAQAPDPWQEAAVWCALLGPGGAAGLLRDDGERSRLAALAPEFAPEPGRPGEVSAVPLTADDPEEVAAARLSLATALDRARTAGSRSRTACSRTACSRTVTRRGQRRPWPRSLSSRADGVPRGTGRGRHAAGRILRWSVRPGRPKGRP